MPQVITLSPSKYSQLLKDIRLLIEQGRQKAVHAANRELVLTYWKMGQRLVKEGLVEQTKHRAAILQDISDELSIDLTTLKRTINFYQTYTILPDDLNLSWSHFKLLTPIVDPKEREWYEDLVENENYTIRKLGEAIKNNEYGNQAQGRKTKKSMVSIKRPTQASYVYRGDLTHVVDGDTVILNIDLGFDVLKKQRIRFACVDTPAMDEPGGQEAYEFVCDKLNLAKTIVVKTNKIDMYGRFVGHIFYSFRTQSIDDVFAKGKYLNEELLAKGLAIAI